MQQVDPSYPFRRYQKEKTDSQVGKINEMANPDRTAARRKAEQAAEARELARNAEISFDEAWEALSNA